MAVLEPTQTSAPTRAAEGIGCVLLGMLLFVGQDGMMKSLLGLYPIWVLIFARGVVAVLVLVPLILVLGAPHRLLTPLWPLHFARGALFAFGFSLFYAAFPFMGLAEVTTLFFAAPLMIAVLASVWLKESIGPHRIAALVTGFAGVLIAMNPTGDGFSWVAVLPVVTAATYAAFQILARKIGDRDTTLTAGLYTVAFAGALIVPAGWLLNQMDLFQPEHTHLTWHWPDFDAATALQLGALGLLGMSGFMLVTRAYQVTSASIVAPFDYVYLPIATAMAWIAWAEVPPPSTVAGMSLIMAGGLYLGYREVRSARATISPAPVGEATLAPGNPVGPMTVTADVDNG